jgi:hypothetical protein
MHLPTFLIAGAVKGGTTSLNYYLKQHSEIFISPLKEPRYFAYDPAETARRGENDLAFPIKTWEAYTELFAGVTTEKAIGEASPHYMITPFAARRISETIPDVKLIFSLRHPVRRAYSVYLHQVRLGNEQRPVHEAFSEDEHRVRNGRYYSLLVPWFDLFDNSQIKVILLEELIQDPLRLLNELYRFLEVREGFVPDLTIRNKGGALKNRRLGRLLEKIKAHPLQQRLNPYLSARLRSMAITIKNNNLTEALPLPEEVEKRLGDYYREDITQLERLLEKDLSCWKI